MLVTRQQIVDEARTWLGTPYQHQASLKGVAVDCIGYAMRAIERHGGARVLERAFTGFQALPNPDNDDWRVVLDLPENPTLQIAQAQYRSLARQHHPDRGGDPNRMAKINRAWDQAKRELA